MYKLSPKKVVVLLLGFLYLISIDVSAQVTIVSDNFDDGNITAAPVWSNNTSSFSVSNVSPLVGTHSLVTNTNNSVASIYTQYATNTNLTTANYTWNLIYRANTSSNPDELPFGAAITTSTNHWRFWIAADGTNPTTCDGFYVSHSAGNIKFCRKKNNSTWDIATYPISLNTTYSIKIVRRYDGYFDFYVDAGTSEPVNIRWSGYATDVFNNGNNNIYMMLHANETSANRFKFDNAGLISKTITISQLTNGVYTGDLEEGLTNVAVLGFAATTIGSITLEDVKIQNTNSNSQGNFVNVKLVKSVDNSFATVSDNTVMTGLTISLNGSYIFIEDINTTINNSTVNFFLVLDNVNNNGGSPPSSIQFSMACNNNCGVPFTNVVTTNGEKVNDFSFSGTNYNILRVFTWKNTTTVGDFTDNWQNSSAWEPYRTNPSPNDVLVFSKGGTLNPLNIPTETAKRIIIKNNTTVNITTTSLTNGSATLTVGNGTNEDFGIEAGSSLNVSSTGNTFALVVPSNSTATISGNLNLSGKNHQLSAVDANSISFKNGSIFNGGTGLSGNPFGNVNTGSVVFESGSTLIDQVGLDYFSNANVLTLNTGSNYKHSASSAASINNKTFSNLEITSGATYTVGVNTLNILGDVTGSGALTITSGILNIGGNYSNSGSFTCGTGTVNYNGASQNVKAGNYANINFTNSGSTKTLLGNINFATGAAATLELGIGVKLVCDNYTITSSSASSTVNINGHLQTSNTNGFTGSTSTTIKSTNSPTINLGVNSTIEFNSNSTQSISARTDYNNIIASGSGTKNASSLTLNGNLEITNGVILNMSSNVLSGTFTTSGSGIFRTANTGLTPVPANLTWAFEYDANGASQNIVAGNYSKLSITGTNTKTARGDVNVSGLLTINASRTFNMGTFVLQSVSTTSGTGILRTDNISANPIPSNKNWTFTVLYNGASQSVVPGNYTGLSIAGSGTKTTSADIIVNGILNIASSNILDVQSYLISGMSSTQGTGRLKTANTTIQPLVSNFNWTFTIEYYATTANQYVVPGNYTSLVFSGSRGSNNLYIANNDTIRLSSSLTTSATFTTGGYNVSGNTFIYNGSTQNITAFTYNNLNIEGTGDKTASGTINVNGNLHINSDRILIMSTRQLASVGSTSGSGILRTAFTSTNAIPQNKTWTFTVEYNSTSSQTIVAGNYSSLTISGTRNANNVTLSNGGTINVSNVFSPSVTFTTGNYIVTNNTFNFNGDAQNIPAFTFNNLTVSGTDNKLMSGNVQVSGLLNLVERNLILNGNTLNINGTFSRTNAYLFAGTCASPSSAIVIGGTGSNITVSLHPSANYINNFTLNRANGATISSNVIINGTLTLTAGTLVINDTLSFNQSNTIISRTSGTISPSTNATLIFGACTNSGDAIVLPNGLFASSTFKKLILNRSNGLTIGNQMLNITSEIKILSGVLNTNNNITLISNAQGTARVDAITCNGCNIIGNVIAQRFIPGGDGKRRWRLLSSPTNVSGYTLASDIIDDIIVTGPGGASKGFDDSPNNNGSIKTYDENVSGGPNNGWKYPSKIDTSYAIGKGLCVFVRGDRNVADPFINWAPSNDVTMDFTGALKVGDFNFPVTYTNTGNSADGWNLVGNPYASTISWEASEGWVANGMQSKIWLYNPTTGTYGLYDNNLGEGTNSCTQFIASGQAFMVKTTSADAVLTIKETAKVDSIPSNFFRKTNRNLLRIKVSRDSLFSDESILYLTSTGTGSINDPSDAQKFFNDELNFYLRSDNGYNLAINEHPIPNAVDTIKASIFSYSAGNVWTGVYNFSFEGIESYDANLDVYLEDIYLNKITNIREKLNYEFEITNDVNSYGNNRFRILLGLNGNPLGLDQNILKSIKVYPNPFANELVIKSYDKSNASFQLYNNLGVQIQQGYLNEFSGFENTITTNALPSGVYIIKLKTESGVETRKVIKE